MQKFVFIEVEELESLIEKIMRRVLDKHIQKNPEANEILNVDQAAEMLHIAKQTLYTMTSNRRIPFIKTGKLLLFHRSELQEWLMTRRKKTIEQMVDE